MWSVVCQGLLPIAAILKKREDPGDEVGPCSSGNGKKFELFDWPFKYECATRYKILSFYAYRFSSGWISNVGPCLPTCGNMTTTPTISTFQRNQYAAWSKIISVFLQMSCTVFSNRHSSTKGFIYFRFLVLSKRNNILMHWTCANACHKFYSIRKAVFPEPLVSTADQTKRGLWGREWALLVLTGI